MTKKHFFHNLRVTLNLSLDYASIAGFIYLHQNVFPGPFSYIVICWLIGIKQFSIGESLLHEASHGILFYPKKLNKFSDVLVAFPFFQTISHYRSGHSKHHKLIAKKGDPLLERHTILSKQESFLSEWFFRPIFGLNIFSNLKKTFGKIRQKKFKPVRFFWLTIILSALSLGLGFELLIYWLIPLFWCQKNLIHWSELTDHYMVKTQSRSVNSWVYNFLIAHNAGYHAAHHFRPNVPFYQLPELQKKEAGRIKTEWTSGFWDTYQTIHQRHRRNLLSNFKG